MIELLLTLFVLAAVVGPWVVALVIGLWKKTSRTVDRLVSLDSAVDDALDLFDDDTTEDVDHFVQWEAELRERAQ